MTKTEKYTNEVVEDFRLHGCGCVLCPNPIKFEDTVFEVFNRFASARPNSTILIVTETYDYRIKIANKLTEAGYTKEKFNYTLITKSYINQKYHYAADLIIACVNGSDIDILNFLKRDCTFYLYFIIDRFIPAELANTSYIIKTTVSAADVKVENTISPVEETRIPVELSEEDRITYNKYKNFISESVAIFGGLENIEKCKIGDVKLGISSAEYRDMVAKNNGWSETLDTTFEFNKQIDDIYNPNSLLERALTFYNIVRGRRTLTMNNEAKLEAIKNIVGEHIDDKILIVSKDGKFAARITAYLNEEFQKELCGDYHDEIDDMYVTDANGQYVLIKSGKDKGKPKVFKAQAISTLNNKKFLANNINVLSMKFASNQKLCLDYDIIIFTTSLIDDISTFKYRFNDIECNTNPNIIYRVYCQDTIESEKFINEKIPPYVTIIDKNDNNFIIDENNGDIIL